MSVARAEARAAEIIATSRVRMGPEIVAATAIGKDGTEDEYRAALAVALTAGDWKPRPLYDLPRWEPILRGPVKRVGNLIHLRLDSSIAPWTGDEPECGEFVARALEFSNLAREAGYADLARAAIRAGSGMDKPAASPTPVDLWQRHEAPDLPADVLPTIIEEFARRHGEVMGADPAGIAMSALAVCASAIPDSIQLQVKRHDPTWREAARLWVGLVGMPSTKKSPIMSAALRPLRRLDKALVDRYIADRQKWLDLPKELQKTSAEPPQRRHIVEDATIEALQVVLKDSPDGILSAQDELSGWFGAMDKYSPGKGAAADRAFWLRAFNGGTYSVNRVSRGAVLLPNLSINLLGGIQPEPLLKLANDAVDDGLIQRFLPVVLRPATAGKDAPAGAVVANYGALVERLTRLRPPPGPGNLSEPAPIRFSDGAVAIRERLEREHVELVEALESVSPKLAAHFGKFDGLFARLCLLWHCIEAHGELAAEISTDTAERVAVFMETFIRPSAIAFYAGLLGMHAGHEKMLELASLIVAREWDEFTARDVQRAGQTFKGEGAEVERLCAKLDAFGWLDLIPPPAKGSAPRWRVNPAVHTLFAERGRIEAERREKARKAIEASLASPASR